VAEAPQSKELYKKELNLFNKIKVLLVEVHNTTNIFKEAPDD